MAKGGGNGTLDPVFAATNAAYLSLSKLKEPQEREQALRFVADRLGVQVPKPGIIPPDGRQGLVERQLGDTPTAKEFMVQKKPARHIDKIACLAYYLTHHKDMQEYKTKDLSALNTEAKQPRFTNAAKHVNNAMTAHLLTSVGRGMKSITSHGEDLVNALPDQEKVKQVIQEATTGVRRRKKSGRRAKTK